MQVNATVNIWPGLFAGSAVNVELLGVQQELGSYVTGATITCLVSDSEGNVVATLNLDYLGKRVTMGFASFADGNYRALLQGNVSLVAGETYEFAFSCASPVFQFSRYITAQARNG